MVRVRTPQLIAHPKQGESLEVMPREMFEAEISHAYPRRANRGKDPRATMWILSGLLALVE